MQHDERGNIMTKYTANHLPTLRDIREGRAILEGEAPEAWTLEEAFGIRLEEIEVEEINLH